MKTYGQRLELLRRALICLVLSSSFYSDLAFGNEAIKSFTTPEGPASDDNCSPKRLGNHPHPMMLVSCFYFPYENDPDSYHDRTELLHHYTSVSGAKVRPEKLLRRYASKNFLKALRREDQYEIEVGGVGHMDVDMFIWAQDIYNFFVMSRSFNKVEKRLDVNLWNMGAAITVIYYFVIENDKWRIDDIGFFNSESQTTQTVRSLYKEPQWGEPGYKEK